MVEAAFAFGSTPWQALREVQIPLALRTIMSGLNQTLMLALSMVVIAAIIGAKGLGDPVRTGLNNLQPGMAAVGGLGIVLLAIILDRITQALGRTGPRKSEGKLGSMLKTLAVWARLGQPLPGRSAENHTFPQSASSLPGGTPESAPPSSPGGSYSFVRRSWDETGRRQTRNGHPGQSKELNNRFYQV